MLARKKKDFFFSLMDWGVWHRGGKYHHYKQLYIREGEEKNGKGFWWRTLTTNSLSKRFGRSRRI